MLPRPLSGASWRRISWQLSRGQGTGRSKSQRYFLNDIICIRTMAKASKTSRVCLNWCVETTWRCHPSCTCVNWESHLELHSIWTCLIQIYRIHILLFVAVMLRGHGCTWFRSETGEGIGTCTTGATSGYYSTSSQQQRVRSWILYVLLTRRIDNSSWLTCDITDMTCIQFFGVLYSMCRSAVNHACPLMHRSAFHRSLNQFPVSYSGVTCQITVFFL